MTVDIAFYNAFNARQPERLEYFDLAQGAGVCTSFSATNKPITVVAQAGYVRAPEDTAEPLALSAQRTFFAAHYAYLWIKLTGDSSGPPV